VEQILNLIYQELLEIRKTLSSGVLPPIQTPSPAITYGEWAGRFVEKYKAPKAKHSYLVEINRYLKNDIIPAFGGLLLSEITTELLENFLHAIPSDSKRSHVSAILSESLRKANDLRYVPFNPFLGVEFKRYENPALGALTHSEYMRFLSFVQIEKDMYDLSKTLLMTGLRQGEALALQPSDFDFERKEVHISKSYERLTGNLVKPKTKAGFRTIPIESPLIAIIKRRLAPNNERIFPYRSDSVSRWFSKRLKRLKLDFSGHILRHTFITNCYELEIPPYAVQVWSGHSKQEQAKTYLTLRRAEDFYKTEIVEYTLALKKRVSVIGKI